MSGTLALNPPMPVDAVTPFSVASVGTDRLGLEDQAEANEYVLVATDPHQSAATGQRPTEVDQLLVDTSGQSTEFTSVLNILVRWAAGHRIEGELHYIGEDGTRGRLSLQNGQWTFDDASES
ncbi:hypothetical protein [Streptomyces tendae]|uniref:hypothetical protein n=1 Tax=Streptomyces tendae TaxID=1932 RepID=UPI003EB766EC